jgi:Kef-type K+ transport system membrane component KefB
VPRSAGLTVTAAAALTTTTVFTLTAATIDDIIAWPLLALALVVASAGNFLTVLWTLLLAVGDVLALFLLVRPALRFISRRVKGQDSVDQGTIFAVTFILFGMSFYCEIIGMTYLVGAFQVGLMMPRRSHLLHELSMKIEDLVVVLFMPLFFTVSGLRTQLGHINTPEMWGLTAVLCAVALASKVIGERVFLHDCHFNSTAPSSVKGVALCAQGVCRPRTFSESCRCPNHSPSA